MNKILILLLSFLICLNATAADNSVWGKIVAPEPQIKGVPYKYFVYYEQSGQSHAYPIETNQKEIAESVKQNLNQKVRVLGEVKEVTLQVDGPNKKILVFIPKEIKPLSLAELSIGNTSHVQSPAPAKANKQQEYDGGGIRINDNIANGIIYTGAAVLIGSQIGKMLFKKR